MLYCAIGFDKSHAHALNQERIMKEVQYDRILINHHHMVWLEMAKTGTAKSRKRRKPISFTASKRKCMLDDLDTKDYKDLVLTVIEKLQGGLHLKRSDSRRQFDVSRRVSAQWRKSHLLPAVVKGS